MSQSNRNSQRVPIIADANAIVGAPTLAIVGGGPKAAAIAAKAAVLGALDLLKVNVCIIEAREVASNWSGKNGFTNGKQPLGTNPEKDVGFPYDCQLFDRKANDIVNEWMLSFSWQAFNVASHKYSEWIDRNRPAPIHKEFAEYLSWVIRKAKTRVFQATAHRLHSPKDGGEMWLLVEPHDEMTGCNHQGPVLSIRKSDLVAIDNLVALPVNGVVVSGPGDPIQIDGMERLSQPEVLNGQDYWHNEKSFHDLPKNARIGVFGGGETAASILLSLIQHTDPSVEIELISASGLIYTRGEGFFENQLYSCPEKWRDIEEIRRPDFIKHTDRGVFSVHAREQLEKCERVKPIKGYVQKVRRNRDQIAAEIRWNSRKGFEADTRMYHRIIVARGFDPWGLPCRLLPNHLGRLTNRTTLVGEIDHGLRLPNLVTGGVLNVHVPALSGLSQGPGFMNLSCLGTLADRILSCYQGMTNHHGKAIENVADANTSI